LVPGWTFVLTIVSFGLFRSDAAFAVTNASADAAATLAGSATGTAEVGRAIAGEVVSTVAEAATATASTLNTVLRFMQMLLSERHRGDGQPSQEGRAAWRAGAGSDGPERLACVEETYRRLPWISGVA
jgi:hypothetical protein